jgi:Ca-activated chloride channel family protein
MPDLATLILPPTGLFSCDDASTPIPLVGVSVEGTITGLCARVSVAHRYRNAEATPIEAVYLFPLDEGAAVCGFEAVIDDVVVVGRVEERDRAFERYDEAIEQGHGAFLLDEERPDVFRASIGNLAPGKEVLVRLTYVTELPVADGQLRFTLPTTIAPKYAPAEDLRGVGRPEAEAVNPPVAWQVPYGLHLRLRVQMPGGLTGLSSPSHPIAIALEDGHAIVTLAAQEVSLDRDFVLAVDASALKTPHVWVDEGAAVAVGFVPDLPDTPVAAEVVFVVDRSGSMHGASIAEVRNALQLCLRAMTSGCCFNIIGFGSTYAPLFPESRVYDESSLAIATRYVEQLQADLGGTEILPSLEFVLGQPSRSGLPRQVVVLTDGEVTNTDAVLALVKSHRTRARVFAFGIGAAASQHLVKGMARVGGGTAEFIHPGERIEAKVVRQVSRILSPAVTDVRLEWIGGDVATAPADLPPIFRHQQLLAYGLVTDAMPRAVRLSARGPAGPLSWEVPIVGLGQPDATVPVSGATVAADDHGPFGERPLPSPGGAIATLAARARIRELEEGEEWLTSRGSLQHHRRPAAVRQQIIDLSVRYGLLSRETSFVAIEHRAVPVQGDMQLRRVPVALASGWAGVRPASPFLAASSMPGRAGLARRHDVGLPMTLGAPAAIEWGDVIDESPLYETGDVPAFRVSVRAAAQSRTPASTRAFEALSGLASWLPRRTQSPARPAGLDALVKLQRAAGAWDLDAALAEVLGRDLEDVRRAMPAATAPSDVAARAWATALALAWLERHASAQQEEWRTLAIKAHVWLGRDTTGVPLDGVSWEDAARAWLDGTP